MSDKSCPRTECSCLVAGQCKSDLYSTCKIKFAPITAIAPVVKPAIADAEARAAYNTLRNYCKQTFDKVGCSKCPFANSTPSRCVFGYDADNGYTMPADWSME